MPISTVEAAVTDGSVVDCTCDHILTEIGLPTPPRTKLAIKSSWAECTNDRMDPTTIPGETIGRVMRTTAASRLAPWMMAARSRS